MKVALVCDWLTNVGGAERVLETFHKIYPSAPIYTSKYDPSGIDWFKDADVRTGWLQIFPTCLRRFLSPLRQIYFSRLDLSDYDVIISVTGAEAKSIKKGTAIHFCYCHVPTQYYWQFYDEYLKNPGFGILDPIVRLALKILIKPLRRADFNAAKKPDYFITISDYAANLIKKYYHRDATVIAPPVNTEKFSTQKSSQKIPEDIKKPYFITTARQVTWKRLDLCIKACLKTHQHLVLIGDGPEQKNLKKLAGNSNLITFLPTMSQSDLISYLQSATAYLFPSLEPFGIAPVEALASGCPVIALQAGGSLDFIKNEKNGLFFKTQTVTAMSESIEKITTKKFSSAEIKKTAAPFSTKIFQTKIKKFINQNCKEKYEKNH